MKYIWTIFFVLISSVVTAQKKLDAANLECQYQYIYVEDTLKKIMGEDDRLVLLVGSKLSKCYSYYSLQIDSLQENPKHREIFDARFKEFLKTGVLPPHKRMKAYIYKNLPEGKMTVTDGMLLQDYIYTDSLNNIDWTISDSTKTILNYTVQMATCDYRGHHWTAWFAPDVPVSDGPWKLHGLPGLIMEAYDTKAYHHFTLVGIRKVKDMPIVMSKTYVGTKKYEKVSRQKFIKMERQYYEDTTGIIRLETGIDLAPNSSPKILTFQPLETE
ncbi:GLPGLI family protein [Prevotella sp. HUN102]|uniref:GLPGLI family protein n=1 Tax=Prevotella sp. HUN102 TaxID=1392486 RepID=UPI00048A7F93|nr:GLPGLI family protein [Prevotella sp. HUN102]